MFSKNIIKSNNLFAIPELHFLNVSKDLRNKIKYISQLPHPNPSPSREGNGFVQSASPSPVWGRVAKFMNYSG